MRLEEAKVRLDAVVGRPFREILNESNSDLIIDKGRAGKALEIVLGLENSSRALDFENGELKSNKCDRHGDPLETVFIAQISSAIDDMLAMRPFEETHLCEKIKNILYVPVCKADGPNRPIPPSEWTFLPCIHVNLSEPRFSPLMEIWKSDYYSICQQLKEHIETKPDGFIHTSNGRHIQVRSKDSKPYHPIFSQVYGKYVSDKNHAFYFQKQFVYDIRRLAGVR